MITVKIEGMAALQAKLAGMGKQIPFAASKALNNVAFKVNAEIKEEMKRVFKGGATAFSLRAFRVEKSTKQSLVATISLRTDAPEGGISYEKALRHLFTSGTRDWKKVEGALRGRGLMPNGYMIVPGAECPLDSRGNIKRTQFAEMFAVLRSSIRNLRIYTGRHVSGKGGKEVGFFVIMPGVKSHLHPGIYRRVETTHGVRGKTTQSSVVQPYLMFVKPGKWRQFISLQKLGQQVVSANWQSEFDRELKSAIASAR